MAYLFRNSALNILNNPAFVKDIVLKRESPGENDSTGEYVPGSVTEYELKGSVQPSTDSERRNLPEGETITEAITVYITTRDRDEIRPLRVGTSPTNSDIIFVNSLNYAVRFSQDWSENGYLKAVCTLLDNQDV